MIAYDGDHIALAFLDSDAEGPAPPALTNRYLHNPQVIDQVFADEQFYPPLPLGEGGGEGGNVIYPLADHLGTARDLADYDAALGITAIANHRVYDSYGQRISETNAAVDHAFSFTGRELDEETGLQSNRARYYEASTGRFISEDPIGFDAGDKNLTRYVSNNSTNRADPYGLDEIEVPWRNGSPVNWRRESGRFLWFEPDYDAFRIGTLEDGEWVRLDSDLGGGRIQLAKLEEVANRMHSANMPLNLRNKELQRAQLKAQIRQLAEANLPEIEGAKHGITGFAEGLCLSGPRKAVEGCFELAKDPIQAGKNVVGFITRHPDEVFGDILDSVDSQMDSGQGLGELTFDAVVADRIPGIAKAGVGKTLKVVGKYELYVDKSALSANGLGGVGVRKKVLVDVDANGQQSVLLPGEGRVGTFDELDSMRVKGDNLSPHHIPSANHMKQHGVSRGDGISIMMEQPTPGAGGRHRRTFTYGTDADVGLSPRDALGQGVRDARSRFLEDGIYDPNIRERLQEVIRCNQQANPGLFDKK